MLRTTKTGVSSCFLNSCRGRPCKQFNFANNSKQNVGSSANANHSQAHQYLFSFINISVRSKLLVNIILFLIATSHLINPINSVSLPVTSETTTTRTAAISNNINSSSRSDASVKDFRQNATTIISAKNINLTQNTNSHGNDINKTKSGNSSLNTSSDHVLVNQHNPSKNHSASSIFPLINKLTTTYNFSETFLTELESNFRQRLLTMNGSNFELLGMKTAKILGLRVEEVSKGVEYENKGVSVILSEKSASIRLFGERFSKHTIVRFVTEMGVRGMDCDDVSSTKSFAVYKTEISDHSVLANIELPRLTTGEDVFYLCARENNTDMPWVHQGTEQWLQLRTYQTLLPLWLIILFVVGLLMLSGLFSGLNLGLMALDQTEMKILANTGTPKERRYAKLIQPLRKRGNFLLCSLLLGNVMVNSTLTILLDELSSGLIAIIVSTFSIVILGEIIPQAICSRHGLAVGAKTVYLTKFFMCLTFPISYPISVLLDKALGEEIGNVYNRDRLKELIRVTHGYNDIEKDEMNIISGALDLRQKTVKDIMTKLEKVFMLPVETILDFDTVSEIMAQGYSRIPIYEGTRQKVVALLFTKDLALYDPADKMPLKRFCQFYNNKMMFVLETTTLDVLFKDFKQGDQGHMAFVQQYNDGATMGTDPFYEVIGLVTLEDVIEELIQAEINDETDVHTYKNERSRTTVVGQLHRYPWNDSNERVEVSPQLCLAAYQYLSTAVQEFGTQRISKNILQRLLNQNFFFQIKIRRDLVDKTDDSNALIYQRGKVCDYFVLILEGRVQSEMGKENLVFESGPFTYFGVQALHQNLEAPPPPDPGLLRKVSIISASTGGSIIPTPIENFATFLPDYTVRAITDVTFLRISRSIYMAAIQATNLERTYLHDTHAQKEVVVNFEEQIDKMRTSSHSFSNYVSSNSSDSESGLHETDESYDCKTTSTRASDSSQQLNGTAMNKRRSNLSEIILTPTSLLAGDGKREVTKSEQPQTDSSAEKNKNSTNNNNEITSVASNGALPQLNKIYNNNASKSKSTNNSLSKRINNRDTSIEEEEGPTSSSGSSCNKDVNNDDKEQCKL